MIRLLALRNLMLRPWRSVLLLLGYSLGVAVMIVLLSIGEALLAQARDEKLVGGGSITVLPQGIDVEVMKTGGLGGMFFSIGHARFLYRQVLASPRFAPLVSAAAPQIEDKLLYLCTRAGRELKVMASADIPSRTAGVGAAPTIVAGAWSDDDADRAWRDPSPRELRDEIDHFHLPPPGLRNDATWAEWHYFNVLSADRRHWAFISFIVGGQVPNGKWGAQVLVTLHTQGGGSRRFSAIVPANAVRFSTADANLQLGASSVTVLDDGRYAVRAHARDEQSGAPLDVDLVVTPAPGDYFPGAEVSSDSMASGYVVPGLRASAAGTICVASACDRYDGAQAYHDHNWGTWRGVTWDWGAARAGQYTLLYGRVETADAGQAQPLFAYLVDSLGFLTVFRPREIRYDDSLTIRVAGGLLHVPARATFADARGDDTLRVELTIEDAAATDTRGSSPERGDALGARRIARPYFIQMKGLMRITGRVAGRPIGGEGAGFFETYR